MNWPNRGGATDRIRIKSNGSLANPNVGDIWTIVLGKNIVASDFTMIQTRNGTPTTLALVGMDHTVTSADIPAIGGSWPLVANANNLTLQSTPVNVTNPAIAPTVTSAPAITGVTQVGQPASGTAGTYAGSPAPNVVRSWLVDGVVVATTANYTPVTADAGKLLTISEVATNAAGSVTANSEARLIAAGLPALPTPVLLESFEDTAGFTMGGGAVAAANPAWKVQGANSMKVTGATSTATGTATKLIAGVFDPKAVGTLVAMANVDPATAGQVVQAGIGLSKSGSTPTVSSLAGYTQVPPALRSGVAIIAGSVEKEMNSIYVMAAATGFSLRLAQSQAAPGGTIISYDSMLTNGRGNVNIIISADDHYTDQYIWLYQQHLARGIPFNINIARDVIGTANRFTKAQFNEMFASGLVGIGLNGTANDAACDQNDVAEATTGSNGIIANQDYVVSEGWITDRSKLVMGCWPFGTWSEALCVAFENAGIKHMRTTQPGVQLGNMHTRFGRTPQWMTAWTYSMGGKTAAQLKAAYDLCKAGGYTLNMFGHHWLANPGGADVSQAAYLEFLDYVAPDVAAGSARFLTYQQFMEEDGQATFPSL